MRIDGKKEPHVYVRLCWGFMLPLWFYRVVHLLRICTHALTFTLFPFNSLCLLVNLHANAVETCHCISCFFPNTHSVFLSLSRTSWGLEVKSLGRKRPVCICDLMLIDCSQGKTPPRDTPEQTWSRICSELRARYPWTLPHHFYLSTSFPVISPLSSKGETGIRFSNRQNQ